MHMRTRERSQNRAGSLFSRAASITDFEKAKSKLGYLQFPEFVLKKYKDWISKGAKTLWQFLYNESLHHLNHAVKITRQEIATQIGTTVRTVSRLLDQLELTGFIFRKRENKSLRIHVRAPEKVTDHIIYISIVSSKKYQSDIPKKLPLIVYLNNNIINNTPAVGRVSKIQKIPQPKPVVYDLRKKKDDDDKKPEDDKKLKEECSKRIHNINQQIQELQKITHIDVTRRDDETLMGFFLRVNALKTNKQREAEERIVILDRTRNDLTNEIKRIENRWKPKPDQHPDISKDFMLKPGSRTLTAFDILRLKRGIPFSCKTQQEAAFAVRFGPFQHLEIPHAISCCLKIYQDGKWSKPKSLKF